MSLAHVGFAASLAGVCFVTVLEVEEVVRLAPDESATVSGYEFRFRGVRDVAGPNYRAVRAEIEVTREGRPVARLAPEKRTYFSQSQPMTEAGIDPGISPATSTPPSASRSARGRGRFGLHYKPFVRWIWLGAILMAFGGVLAATDRRYRRRAPAAGGEDPLRTLLAEDPAAPTPERA